MEGLQQIRGRGGQGQRAEQGTMMWHIPEFDSLEVGQFLVFPRSRCPLEVKALRDQEWGSLTGESGWRRREEHQRLTSAGLERASWAVPHGP